MPDAQAAIPSAPEIVPIIRQHVPGYTALVDRDRLWAPRHGLTCRCWILHVIVIVPETGDLGVFDGGCLHLGVPFR